MKLYTTLFLCVLFSNTLSAQGIDTSKTDNNPRLTTEESDWLNQAIKPGDFNFTGKTIGFAELTSGGFYGIGKFSYRLTKKEFFRRKLVGRIHQLYILTDEEKKKTNGYDAILVIADKNIKGKMRRMKRDRVLEYSYNSFPLIPADAGLDNDPLLTKANSDFFNEIYKYDNHFQAPFDFTGKKVAIFQTHCDWDKIEQRSISEYVERIKQQVDEYGFCRTEFTYLLNEQQKKDSGGYDVIIQYRCKMDLPLNSLIAALNKNYSPENTGKSHSKK
jgi:hypothetical protein